MNYFIDTHTHIYLDDFKEDIDEVIKQAVEAGVSRMLLPNVDLTTADAMLNLANRYPEHCLPMMGLHPTSVKDDVHEILPRIRQTFENKNPIAIGESGIDLYWDKTHYEQQVISFKTHIEWALELDLPLVVHARNSLSEIMQVLEPYRNRGLKGIMHCFPGTVEDARWFTEFGLLLGIGGVVTYKKSEMALVVQQTDLHHLVLETDAPYLPPVPFRGKRNMPAYLPYVAEKIAEIKNVSPRLVAEVTTDNASKLFNLPTR
jgi:TatD DNase family protein